MGFRLKLIPLAFSLGLACMVSAVAAREGHAPLSVDLLQSEWENNPANLQIALLFGGLLNDSGETRRAKKVVEQSMDAAKVLMEERGDSPDIHYMLGMAGLFLERFHLALSHFEVALSLRPDREEIHLGLIRALMSLDRTEEAIQALDLALTLFPENLSIKLQLAEAHERSGNFGQAITILEELHAMTPEDGEIFNRLLSTCVAAGDAGKAAPLFEKLVEAGSITPIEAVIHVYRIYLRKGDLRAARIELQKAMRMDENHPLLKDAFREYYSLQADAAEKEDNFRRAILFWERALENVPEDWQARYRLATAHAALNNHQEALDLFLSLLEERPADPLFYANLAKTLIALERYESAGKVLQLGLQAARQSKDPDALAQLQRVSDQLNQAAQLP